MQFMTMLAIALLAGFAMGALVWAVWSIVERVVARKRAAPPVAAEQDSAKAQTAKPTSDTKGKSDAKARAK